MIVFISSCLLILLSINTVCTNASILIVCCIQDIYKIEVLLVCSTQISSNEGWITDNAEKMLAGLLLEVAIKSSKRNGTIVHFHNNGHEIAPTLNGHLCFTQTSTQLSKKIRLAVVSIHLQAVVSAIGAAWYVEVY